MPKGVYIKTEKHKKAIKEAMGKLFSKYSLSQRFFNKVIKSKHCWKWKGATNNRINGYGILWVKGKRQLAHRISWIIHKGKISKDRNVLHKCDNPICVNPKHLFTGTQLDNVRDMYKKRRNAAIVGEACTRHILTSQQVKEIRNKYIPWKYSMNKLAKEYNVTSNGCIFSIIKHRTWKHI